MRPYIPSLLRTLINKPNLARLVEYIEWDTFRGSDREGTSRPYTESDFKLFQDCVSKAEWRLYFPDLGLRAINVRSTLYSFIVLLSLVEDSADVALPPYPRDGPRGLLILANKQYERPGRLQRLCVGNPASLQPFALECL